MFNNLDHYEKLSLLDGLRTQWYRMGEIVVEKGDSGDLFYIIESGTVECLIDELSQDGKIKEKVIRKLSSGDHFGELSLINNEVRTLTVRCCSEKAKILVLDRSAFNRILGQIDQYLNRDYS